MSLLVLPNEALLIISENLHCYRDIRALRLSNRRFYSLLTQCLTQSSTAKCHETLLRCAATAGDITLATELLDNLATKFPSQKKTKRSIQDIDSAIHSHPLFRKGYPPETILDIQSALLTAVKARFKHFVALLLDRGARADFQFPYKIERGRQIASPTPLYLAVRSADNGIFDVLVENGAQFCHSDCPLVLAVRDRQFHMIKVLVGKGRCMHRSSLFEEVLHLNDRATFDHLIDVGLRVDLFGDGALFFFIAKGDETMVRYLLVKGANPHLAGYVSADRWTFYSDFHCVSSDYHSTVYVAILGGHTRICKMLVEEYRVIPDREDLNLAQKTGNRQIIDLLSGLPYDDVPRKPPIYEKVIAIANKDAWS
ncbi:hypothetical protein ASPWEDRAFT_39571 [Aspergillus wentii DTO 134E9]|uniref:Uncharacterized protein n=1 Tax=Aspergillus wentii DTO 134E9 TaxID=1073089 RepID=A0A1L9RSE2_ASPWE|nr:uncharacterized protein ASPWEDRAFT_39571 [Aspergillus wentii DTO 134E9]KAI9930666.1 hypothetical protein MW887_011421 [Aspergillus wentii]OJJ37829.1 hypothetical protein ASPWEDRAFT_39571 [Aspergillus wentii DTO 134E9]